MSPRRAEGDCFNSEYHGNYHAIRPNPWMLRTKPEIARQSTDESGSSRHQNGAVADLRRTRSAQAHRVVAQAHWAAADRLAEKERAWRKRQRTRLNSSIDARADRQE
jgi:hypothetical protein